MQSERLLDFAEYLEKEVSDDDFDPTDDEFGDHSIQNHIVSRFGEFRIKNLGGDLSRYILSYKGHLGIEALMEFFGVSRKLAGKLFYGESIFGYKITKRALVDMIQEEVNIFEGQDA